jgi:hypothetical protein
LSGWTRSDCSAGGWRRSAYRQVQGEGTGQDDAGADRGAGYGVGEDVRADGDHRGGNGRRQQQRHEDQQEPERSGHPAVRRIGEQDREDRGQGERAGGVPAGEALVQDRADGGLEHVLGQADGAGHGDQRQDGPGPPAGRNERQGQRRGHQRYLLQSAQAGQLVEQCREPAQPRLKSGVERRIEPSRVPPAGDERDEDRGRAGGQQRGARRAYGSGQQGPRFRRVPHGPPPHPFRVCTARGG